MALQIKSTLYSVKCITQRSQTSTDKKLNVLGAPVPMGQFLQSMYAVIIKEYQHCR